MPDDDPAAVSETMLNADAVGMLEFGANQVVLIRSTRDKSTLPLELQRGLVLTVEESKGLDESQHGERSYLDLQALV